MRFGFTYFPICHLVGESNSNAVINLLGGSWAVEGEIPECAGSAAVLGRRTRIVPANGAGFSGGASLSFVDFCNDLGIMTASGSGV